MTGKWQVSKRLYLGHIPIIVFAMLILLYLFIFYLLLTLYSDQLMDNLATGEVIGGVTGRKQRKA